MSATLQLAQQLMACASVTPQDAGCQDLIAERLAPLGFVLETITSGPAGAEVTNLWAKRPVALYVAEIDDTESIADDDTTENPDATPPSAPAEEETTIETQLRDAAVAAAVAVMSYTSKTVMPVGVSLRARPPDPQLDTIAADAIAAEAEASDEPAPVLHTLTQTFVFAGHTDVVPTGPLTQWHSPPFTPTLRDGKLYGRGAADMKTSLAAFVVATEEFLAEHPDTPLTLALLLTSDEEGPALDGTAAVCRQLQERGEVLDYCLVGEPTSVSRTGDMIKNGRRGSLTGRLTVKGVQGHVAYPHLAKNPIHLVASALVELVDIQWDAGNAQFPPTTWQVSNINAGTGAGNVIPGWLTIDFNFRFSPESTAQGLQDRLTEVLLRNELDFAIDWTLGAEPFYTPQGKLVDVVYQAIQEVTGQATQLSTTGGTSDARFLAKMCPQVIELGPPNASIHQVDEHIELVDIDPLKDIYRRVLEHLDAHVYSLMAAQADPVDEADPAAEAPPSTPTGESGPHSNPAPHDPA